MAGGNRDLDLVEITARARECNPEGNWTNATEGNQSTTALTQVINQFTGKCTSACSSEKTNAANANKTHLFHKINQTPQ